MMSRRISNPIIALAFALFSLGPVLAAGKDTFVTLGTQGGPVPNAFRSQPANALLVGKNVYLIDVGDGASEQLGAIGIPPRAVKAVFLSHLHFDHTGGLFALLGLRAQTFAPQKLQIYGPPGTAAMMQGLLAAMEPATQAGYGVPGEQHMQPADMVTVTEIRDGARLKLDDFVLTAARNTHYTFPPGSDLAKRYSSLSFRFDLPDRSIVYTGDTGPSDAVAALAKGADLLVSEMIDVPMSISAVQRTVKDLSAEQLKDMTTHLSSHHLRSEDVGRMAAKAQVGRVVITHLATGGSGDVSTERYIEEIHKWYDGPVEVADDLDRF